MPPWVKPSNGETVIVHLSDLHFGTDNQEHCWQTLSDFIKREVDPALVLVTGDIVDSPNESWYKSAKLALEGFGKPYYVCAGNHDRHPKGNVIRKFTKWFTQLFGQRYTAALFDKTFGQHVVGPEKLEIVPLKSRWNIGLLGLDSSDAADHFARGYVSPLRFGQLQTATQDADVDLVVLLTHHHLQSIRQLEETRQDKIKDLLNLTSMVNSGSLLESLTRAHVDIALHGHEHASHWAKYGSLEKGKRDLSVIGAGSGTGNSALHGCNLNSASFNAIVIAEDRSITLHILEYDGGSWGKREPIPLFNATDSRKLRLLRRAAGKLNTDLNGQVTKYVEFTREHDAIVRWVCRNFRLDKKRFEYAVYNSTGRPVNGVLKVELPNGKSSEFHFDKFAKHPDGDHYWYVACDLDDLFVKQLVNIEFSFVWLAGALLQENEMAAVQKTAAPGLLRRDGFDFAYVFANGPVAFVNLQVTMPPEYAPKDGVEVRVYDQAEKRQRHPDEERELKERVVMLGPGRYSLTVTYPREDWWYVLAWRPVQKLMPSEPETRFRSAAKTKGNALLQEFRKSLPSGPIRDSARLALYLSTSRGAAECTGHLDSAGVAAPLSPSVPDIVRGDLSLMGQAFWGVPASTSRPEAKEDAEQLGFAVDESHLLLLPVRFGLGWTNPSPWAVVRLGITSREAAAALPTPENLHLMLAPSITGLLTAAFEQS